MTTPHLFLSVPDAEFKVKQGRLAWIVEGELARKTHLFERPARAIYRKSGEWIPTPSPAPAADYLGPVVKVLQFT